MKQTRCDAAEALKASRVDADTASKVLKLTLNLTLNLNLSLNLTLTLTLTLR